VACGTTGARCCAGAVCSTGTCNAMNFCQ
jgi:hypothetical protein